jgi:hypothetical protein
MKYFVYNIQNNWSAIAPEPREDQLELFKQFELVAVAHHSFHLDSDVPQTLPNLDFFVLSSGKLKGNILKDAWFSRGIIFKKELYDVLKEFNLPPHLFSPLSIKVKKNINEDFAYFYQLEGASQFIELDSTLFCHYINDVKTTFKVTCFDELKFHRKYWWLHSVKLKNSFPEYDVFGFFYIDWQIYFSERIVRELIKLGVDKKHFVEPEVIFI